MWLDVGIGTESKSESETMTDNTTAEAAEQSEAQLASWVEENIATWNNITPDDRVTLQTNIDLYAAVRELTIILYNQYIAACYNIAFMVFC